MIFIIIFMVIEMKTTVDKKEITVGDPIKYQVELKLKEVAKVELPKTDRLGNFEILDKQEKKEKNSFNFIYTITAFKTGQDTIPKLVIKCINITGDTTEVTTDPIAIKIQSVLPPNIQDIKDIKSPVSIPRNPLPFIISILLFCIAGVMSYWFIYRKRHAIQPSQQVATKPPHEIAYERLRLLKLEEGKIKEYYIELSDIIRRYIEGRYEISAPTETTFELCRELRKVKGDLNQIQSSNIEMIKDFLTNCDMVKFAKYIPPMESIEKDVKIAREIVDKTKVESS